MRAVTLFVALFLCASGFGQNNLFIPGHTPAKPYKIIGEKNTIYTDLSKVHLWKQGVVYQEAETYSWDANAVSYLDSVGITNVDQRKALNELVQGLKLYHIWDSCKAIYPMMGSTAAQHKWNLKDVRDLDAAYRLTFSGTVNHTTVGCDWNGTDGYANTYVNPSTTLRATSVHVSYYSTDNTTDNTSGEIGAYASSSSQFGIRTYVSAVTYNFWYSSAAGGQMNYDNTDTRGYYISSRVAADSAFAYKNATRKTPLVTSAAGTIPNATTYLGRYATNYSDRNCAFATIGYGLSSGQCAKLNALVDTFQRKIERNVLYAWVFMGQSNMMANTMVDSILNDADSIKYSVVQPNGYIWNNASFEAINPGTNTTKGYTGYFGPETSFAKDLVDWSGRPQYIIKRAYGGTYLAQITAPSARDTNDWNAASIGERLYEVDTMMTNANNYVTNTLKKKLKIKGFVWMQGEYDAMVQAYANDYYDQLIPFFDTLTAFATQINEANGFTNEPIKVIGKISNSTAWTYRAAVRTAETNYVTNYGDVLIDNDALPLKWDNSHWTPDGIITFGKNIVNGIKTFY